MLNGKDEVSMGEKLGGCVNFKSKGLNFLCKGFVWKSKVEILGLPLIHIALGRDKTTGKLLVARGVIAIGQFAVGFITIAQFGVGILFSFGQFVAGFIALGQVALAVYFGIGQIVTGFTAIGQVAFGKYVFAQIGYGQYLWTAKILNPQAVEYFKALVNSVKLLL